MQSRAVITFSFLFFFSGRVSHIPGWLPTPYVVEVDFGLLFLLPPPLKARITDMSSVHVVRVKPMASCMPSKHSTHRTAAQHLDKITCSVQIPHDPSHASERY